MPLASSGKDFLFLVSGTGLKSVAKFQRLKNTTIGEQGDLRNSMSKGNRKKDLQKSLDAQKSNDFCKWMKIREK